MIDTLSAKRFDPPVSTSNLVEPERATFFRYARLAFDGAPVVRMLEERLARFHDAAHCITFCNGFWALVLTIRALALPGRTDLLMPSLTYRRMADVAAWTRLRPRFCEVDPETLACSATTMRAAMDDQVAMLLAVHPIVNTCDVDGIVALSAELGLPLLFDSVESAYEHVDSGRIGRFGNAECFSLHASKLLNGFEGGYITTNDRRLAARLAAMRDGDDPDGMDARLNRYHAAMTLAGLDGLDAQVERNRVRYDTYKRLLASISGLHLLPFATNHPTSFKNIVVALTDDWPLSRADTLSRLNGLNVLARAYYHPPLHAKKMAYQHVPAQLPETDRLAERFMLLPCGHHVTADDVYAVVDLLAEMRG